MLHSRITFRTTITALFAAAALQSAAAGAADIMSFTPSRDTTIFSDADNLASSAGESAFAGATASGLARRALIYFDLSDVPAGTQQVIGASFAISVDRTPGDENPMTLHRLLADWGTGGSNSGTGGGGALALPGDATWSHRFFGDNSRRWVDGGGTDSPGGFFDPTPSATLVVGTPDRYVWESPTLAADVQSWIDAPGTNFGWILIGEEAAPRSAKRFYSSEAALVSFRPALTLELAPIPEPSTYAMLASGLGCLALLARRRSRRV